MFWVMYVRAFIFISIFWIGIAIQMKSTDNNKSQSNNRIN